MRFICSTGMIPGYTTPSQPGGIGAGQSPWSVSRFGPFTRNTSSIWILEHYSDYIFPRHFLYELVVILALYPIFQPRVIWCTTWAETFPFAVDLKRCRVVPELKVNRSLSFTDNPLKKRWWKTVFRGDYCMWRSYILFRLKTQISHMQWPVDSFYGMPPGGVAMLKFSCPAVPPERSWAGGFFQPR